MNGPDLLEHAAGLVNRRRREYGEPVDLFEQVARRWSLTLGSKVRALGGISSPAGSCVWHVIGLQRSVREWAMRQGWSGRSVDHKAGAGILIAGLGMLAAHLGYGGVKRAS